MKRSKVSDMGSDEQDHVQSVVTASAILAALERASRPMTLANLASDLEMTAPRVHRHLATLVSLGLVERIEPEPVYSLGWRLVRLGDKAIRHRDVVRLAHSHLVLLQEQIGYSLALVRRVGSYAVVWFSLESSLAPQISLAPGTRLSLSASASGRVIAAFSRNLDISVSPVETDSEVIATDPIANKKELEKRLNVIRDRYYDFHGHGKQMQVFGLATPIFNHHDEIAATLTIIGASGIAKLRSTGDIAAAAKTTSTEISRALGSSIVLP